jgi:glycosyltransferase involved in cell wall biosynthesis
MSAFNAVDTIGASLDSAISQVYPGRYKIVVVDDGSTDATAEVVLGRNCPFLTLIRSNHVGRARALNIAIESAGEIDLIANLDADDLMLPGRILAQANRFRQDSGLGVLGSWYYELHLIQGSARPVSAFIVKPPESDEALRREMAKSFPLCHSCVMYPRSAAMQAGLFNPLLRARLDFDLWLRIGGAGWSFANANEPLGVHVKYEGSSFDKKFNTWHSAIEMLRLNLIACNTFNLGARGYSTAVMRLVYSISRRCSIRRVPRYGTPISSESKYIDQYEMIEKIFKRGKGTLRSR